MGSRRGREVAKEREPREAQVQPAELVQLGERGEPEQPGAEPAWEPADPAPVARGVPGEAWAA
jgi:hypothetical protein